MRYAKGRHISRIIKEKNCFNKNPEVAAWCLMIRDQFNIKTAVETGTFKANTTAFFVNAFVKVYTIDIFEEFTKMAKEKLGRHKNLECLCGKSVDVLDDVCKKIDENETVLFFLDAHGNYIKDLVKMGLREESGQNADYYTKEFDENLCPARQEIEIISKYFKDRCVIIVDDIYNPFWQESGHINFGGVRFDYEYLKPSIDKCYSKAYNHSYICGTSLGWPKSVLTIQPVR